MIKFIQLKIYEYLFKKKDKWLNGYSNLVEAMNNDEQIKERLSKNLEGIEVSSSEVIFNNTYHEEVNSTVYSFSPEKVEKPERHLIVFWGGKTSCEGMVKDLTALANNLNVVVHAFNYPGVNQNPKSNLYTFNDLVSNGVAVAQSIMASNKDLPHKNIIFYGDCLGSSVAEATYQKL